MFRKISVEWMPGIPSDDYDSAAQRFVAHFKWATKQLRNLQKCFLNFKPDQVRR